MTTASNSDARKRLGGLHHSGSPSHVPAPALHTILAAHPDPTPEPAPPHIDTTPMPACPSDGRPCPYSCKGKSICPTPELDATVSDPAALTDAEFVAGNACDEILNALPMDSWGHVISCGYDDNDERCECGTLRERLEAIVAARVAKAVEQERAEGYRQGATEGLDSTDRALFGTWRGLAEHMRTLVDVYADASDRALADRDAEWADRIEALADECANAPCIHLNDMYGNLRALLDDTKATS